MWRRWRTSYAEFREVIRDRVNGVVRVSLGLASTFGEVYRFVEFARAFAG